MDCAQEANRPNRSTIGYSRPSSQVRGGPAPLASFEDLPTEDQFSEASLIEDFPCVSDCLDDRIFHDRHAAHDLANKRMQFQRSDTACSADFNGSLITLTPTCSITPTELESPTKTLTPVTPVANNSQFLIEQANYQFIIQQQQQLQLKAQMSRNQMAGQWSQGRDQTSGQWSRGRDETSKPRQSIDALRVPLSPSITLNDEQLTAEQPNKQSASRKNSWTNFLNFRSRSKSTGNASAGKSPTPSFTVFFGSKENRLNGETNQTKQPKRRRMSSIFSFFKRSNKGRSSLQDLSRQENDLNKNNLLSAATNLDKVTSASSPKVLSDYETPNYETSNYGDHAANQDAEFNCEASYDYIEGHPFIVESVETNVIRKSLSSSQSVKEFAAQIEIVVKEKDEEFDKKIKQDIYLEDKILDEDVIEKLQMKMNFVSPSKVNELDKKEVLLKRTLKEEDRSDTCDEIRSLPGRLPSFRRKHAQQQQQNQQINDSSANPDTNSESDDQTTTITDQLSTQLSSKLASNYLKKNEIANGEQTKNLLEDEDTYNELLYKSDINNSPSQIKLPDKNERLNIKIISIERPRSTTPVNFASFETFINSSANKAVDEQEKIKLKLPEDAFSELVNSSGRRLSPRKSSPQIWLEFCERGLLGTPKYNTRRNSGTDDPAADRSQASIEEAFTPSIANSSTNETLSEYLNHSQGDGFEDDFVNACLADLAHVLHGEQHRFESADESLATKNEAKCKASLADDEQTIRFEANFPDDNEQIEQIKQQPAFGQAFEQTFDQNNNLIARRLACENCERCKLNATQLNRPPDESSETEQLNRSNCKCDCHQDHSSSSFPNFQFASPKRATFPSAAAGNLKTHQRRHSISSDISSASSRLISISSTSSSSSGRMSLRGDISNERLEA